MCARVRVGRLGLRWKSTSVNSSMLPPPPAPPIPPGFILVDRHIEKNAGSTFRELLFQAEKRGLCMYWGYQQRSIAWTAFLEAMEPNNMTASRLAAWVPPRVCMEAHSHIDYGIPWLKRLEQLRVLRSKLRHSPALRTSIVMLLRLRQPLRLYVSFYLWTVAERQGAIRSALVAPLPIGRAASRIYRRSYCFVQVRVRCLVCSDWPRRLDAVAEALVDGYGTQSAARPGAPRPLGL